MTNKSDIETDVSIPPEETILYTEENDPLLNKERHKNKRNMAWFSLFSMIFLAFYTFLFMEPEDVDAYSDVFGTVFMTLVAVIMTYMGTTTWDSTRFWRKK